MKIKKEYEGRTASQPGSSKKDYTKVLADRVSFMDDYENARICSYTEYQEKNPETTFRYKEIAGKEIEGFPICSVRDNDGELKVSFANNTHALIVGATRSGKTTGFAMPFLGIMPIKKNKPSIVVSDPKRELYHSTAKRFTDNGYRVIVVDFLDYLHSACWNPLTSIYRTYQKYLNVENEIGVKEKNGVYYNEFRGVIYESEKSLEEAIVEVKDKLYTQVDNLIISFAEASSPIEKAEDPYWDEMSQIMIEGFLWAMLEDSGPNHLCAKITEDTFSMNTVLRIFDSFVNERSRLNDYGYFTNRDPNTSRAYQLVVQSIVKMSAETTRSCILSVFLQHIKKFRDASIRRITSTNTFEMEELDDGRPTIIYIGYKDEETLHYEVISMFLSDLYTKLIGVAREKGGALSRPFYFLLDEFGNFPKFKSFETVISACGSRNIWFLLIVQSYAQLVKVYGKETTDIIIDNLNMHIFFGSANYETKNDFSEECGKHVIFSPMTAINGKGEEIEYYSIETTALVPISKLSEIPAGECIITQMLGDVIWSRIERSYNCREFDSAFTKEKYTSEVKFSNPKYIYKFELPERQERRPGRLPFLDD